MILSLCMPQKQHVFCTNSIVFRSVFVNFTTTPCAPFISVPYIRRLFIYSSLYAVYILSAILPRIFAAGARRDDIRQRSPPRFSDAKSPCGLAMQWPQGLFYSAGPPGHNQYSFAPAGMWGSTISRCSFSSPFSWWTAEISMPQESMPIIGLGGRFTMAMQVLPTSSSGS